MAQDRTPPDPNSGSMPDWLRQTASDDFDAAHPPTPPSGDQGDAVPDWFSALEPDADSDQAASTAAIGQGTGAITASDAFPDWFTTAHQESSSSALPALDAPDLDMLLGKAPAAPVPPPVAAESSPQPDAPLELPAQSPRTMRERAYDPRPIGSANEDIPEWMREFNPADRATTTEDPTPATISHSSKPAKPVTSPAQPAAKVPSPAPKVDTGGLLGGDISSADIDALINLPVETYSSPPTDEENAMYGTEFPMSFEDPSEENAAIASAEYSRPSQSAEELLTLDDEALDRLLGPMDPTPSGSPTRMMGAAASVVPLSASMNNIPNESATRRDLLNPERPALQAEELPDFVADLRPEDAPTQLSVAGINVDLEEAPASDLDPALQQLRERSKAAQQYHPSAKSTVGPLAEIEGTLVAEPVLIRAVVNATGMPRVAAPDAIPTSQQLGHVEILKRLLDVEEAEHAITGAAAKTRRRIRIDPERYLITALLLAALLIPFFTDKLNLAAPPETAIGNQPSPAQASAFKALDSITPGQPVLMAFEYGPTASGEMDALARDLLHEVFAHNAHPIIVSTDYAGLLHAESLINTFSHNKDELAALGHTSSDPLMPPMPLEPRADYIVLRYLPAGAVGVRALAEAIYAHGNPSGTLYLSADAQGQPIPGFTSDQLASMQSAPVIVLAETSDAVRNWIEQYHPPADSSPNAGSPVLILATSVSAAATAQTYSAAFPGTIAGPLIGLRDAIAYRVLRPIAASSQNPAANAASNTVLNTLPAVLDQRWQSLSLSALTAGVLIVLGALFGAITQLRRRAKR